MLDVLDQTVDHFRNGRPHAERRLRELREIMRQGDDHAVGRAVSALEVLLAIRAGRFDEAELMAEEPMQLAAIRWYQGRLPEVPGIACYPAASALAAAQSGDRAAALDALRRNAIGLLPHSDDWLVSMYGVVEASHLVPDVGIARRSYTLMKPHARLPMVAGRGVACFGSVEHALGVASLTVGEVDRAADHFRAAVNDNLALGHWPAVAASRLRLAEATSSGGSAATRPPVPQPVPRLREVPLTATCVREGTRWRVELGGRSTLVPHAVGMLHLAVLLANPQRDIPARDLVAGVASLHGRTDPLPDVERARLAAGKAIRRALARIAGADPMIGQHLISAVRTGVRCSYRP
jgi:hypothetical protein